MNLRPTGLGVIRDVPWGSHSCQFYRASGELNDAFVPFRTKGVGESWFFSGGSFEQQSLLEACIDRLSEPRARGFIGFRSSGDTSWVEQPVSHRFAHHEVAIDSTPLFSAGLMASSTLVERGAVVDGSQGNQRQPFAVSWRNNAWAITDGLERQRVVREDQLRAIALERERLSVTLHSIGEAVVATDNSSRVVTLNLAAEELTDWTQGEAMGRPISQVLRFINEQSGEPVEILNSAAVAVRGDSGTLLVSRDGATRPVSFTASAIRGSDGRVMGTVLVLRDVMQARRAERQLEQGLRRFELLAETAGQLLQVREPKQSAYSLCARVMEHLDCQVFFNFLVDESTGRLHLHACAGISEQEARALEWLDCGAAICGCAAVEKTRIVAEYILESDDARAELVRAQGVRAYACHPLLGPGGRVLGTLSFGTKTRDAFGNDELSLMKAVTDQVAIAMVRQEDEQALRKSAEALREADQRKNEFLAVLSHELRNPLAPIMSGLHVLEQVAPGSEQARRAQRVIRRQVVQMAHLVDDLLDVARITRNKVALQREMLELNQLLRRAIEDQRGLFDEAGLSLELESPTCCIFVEADATRITQIVSNLLQNAARFSRVGGRTVVSVLVKEHEEVVEIRVTDDGVGITEEIRPRLFQPFMQADTSLDRRKGGLGVGLSLAKALVELHGGEITVFSAGVNQGSQFTVRLPLRSVSWEHDWRSSSSLPAARCVPRRVLVIEDNEDAADTLREALEFSANKVEVAYNGQDGIQKAREFLPDVVFCDIGLPGMSGYEVAATLRRDDRFREAHLVALTGYALPEDRRRAAEAGFDDHLPKPSSVQAIQSLLSKLGAPGS